MDKFVSIIIPVKNEESNIIRCLKSIDAQGTRDIEIIVVDNFSSDQTYEIARKLGAKVLTGGPERSSQRNLGAKKALGDYFLFLDADMELEKKVIFQCLELANKGLPVVIVSEKVDSEGFWGCCRALEKSCYLGDELIEAARFFKKEVFFKLGGFDENLVASEDWDLTQRAKQSGFKIGRTKDFVVHHEKEINPLEAAKKKYYYGKNLGHYFKKHPKLALAQYQPLRPAFLRHRGKLLRQPIPTIGLLILKLSEYLGGGLGFIRGQLR